MALIESLQKAIDYMEEHLLESLSIETIARQASVSPYHFQRMFMILTDYSVGEYLRGRRLTLAAKELSSSDSKVIDLAYKYGYETPEAFSKAFRKQHGVSPSKARKGSGQLQSYNRLTIQVNLRGAEPMNYKIIEKEAFQVVGIKRECPCGETGEVSGIAELWEEVNADGTADRLVQLINGEINGLLGITNNYSEEKETVDYWVAAEHSGEVPGDFTAMTLPSSRWVIFEVTGSAPVAMPEAWNQIYTEWIPSNGYEVADIPAVEAYTDPDSYKDDSSNQIWLAVK
ncbi:AraC family transcriptional regulator [Alkalicoccus halolimnae]|uniref:AraC family transcriptional regulator n=1 Tax=Alkalicoccus halolimnae TaxID=1667239 RepID=A0A5C7F788_9BACI|nr:AraC family transcriptional regulator [Alkalicoccus halolimnae]TXF85268.1 AraC family transcriptional regulator [Alkalicoccus halolimnae]